MQYIITNDMSQEEIEKLLEAASKERNAAQIKDFSDLFGKLSLDANEDFVKLQRELRDTWNR